MLFFSKPCSVIYSFSFFTTSAIERYFLGKWHWRRITKPSFLPSSCISHSFWSTSPRSCDWVRNTLLFNLVQSEIKLIFTVYFWFHRAFHRVYSFGPTFRADSSRGRSHLSEFYMIEAEVNFLHSVEDINSVSLIKRANVLAELTQNCRSCRVDHSGSSSTRDVIFTWKWLGWSSRGLEESWSSVEAGVSVKNKHNFIACQYFSETKTFRNSCDNFLQKAINNMISSRTQLLEYITQNDFLR